MAWRQYLRVKTRNERFLWRMVVAILAAGFVAGVAVDWWTPAWVEVDPKTLGPPEDGPLPGPTPDDDGGWAEIDALAARGEWWAVWKAIPRTMAAGWRHRGVTLLAALTGACWLAFLLQAVQVRGWRDLRLWAPVAGVALGVLSIWATRFLIVWQEVRWGLVESEDWAGGIRFFLVGVGFREELAKLVCFLPLLPFVVRARDELAALVAAACVGVGFGMQENVGYILTSGGTGTLGRLLMPVPFHMAMTGLVGLAAYRACRWPKEWGPQLVAVFGVIVLAHAMYDALIAVPALTAYAIGSAVIFLLLVYQFFRELRPLRSARSGRPDAIRLTANFLFCVSLVTAATFVYLSAAAGWRVAAMVQGQSIAAEGVMVYLFLREMPETMVKV
jgi:RsiW-degrading membrane proteinase PrsW (M82 family)